MPWGPPRARRAEVDVERWTAFSDHPDGGNPAGVVLAAARPDPTRMQLVAADVGYSETAFLVPDGDGRWWVRYFAPEAEVPFCGHATIASAVALARRDPDLARAVLVTSVGEVAVEIDRTGPAVRAELTSPGAHSRPLTDELLDRLLATFGWDRAVLEPNLPPAIGHGGADHPVLALRDRATLAAMAYEFAPLRELMEHERWTTVQVVWREDATVFHARDPFPVGGVVEDPATGAAAAALGAYLRDLGALPADGRFTVHQGHDMGRPSLLHVDASGDGGIRVAGTAVPIA